MFLTPRKSEALRREKNECKVQREADMKGGKKSPAEV